MDFSRKRENAEQLQLAANKFVIKGGYLKWSVVNLKKGAIGDKKGVRGFITVLLVRSIGLKFQCQQEEWLKKS